MNKEKLVNFIKEHKSGDGCSCHLNPPCGYCTDESNSLVNEIADGVKDMLKDVGEFSDGYHSFNELYDHRVTLFIALCKLYDVEDILEKNVWRSKKHSDGELAFGGTWFVLGINKLPGNQITYHLPIDRWDETEFAETLETAPGWDGHTPEDVLKRLKTL